MAIFTPANALLDKYRPSEAEPFDAIRAAHLYNRAGFGATPAEIAEAVKLGPDATLEKLLAFPDQGAQDQDKSAPDLSAIAEYPMDGRAMRQMFIDKTPEERQMMIMKITIANRRAVQETVTWWLDRMGNARHPLQEKLTLFWHGHFTTSARDERSAMLMWHQNELLRRMAAGTFGKFVLAISRDPAMLDYLNNQQNNKARPNENYARELLELFTLGIGNYTEKDIKEAARAFTGWGHDGDQFAFRRFQHDFARKTFLGRTGDFDGGDIVKIILDQPICAEYIATRLFRFFAYDDVEPDLVKALGALLRDNDYELRPLLKTILSSQAFYGPKSIGSQIKSPVQLIVGTCRALGVEVPKDRRLNSALAQMGQVPLAPPNVKGWPGGRAWINTSTLFARNNTALWLAGGQPPAAGRGDMMMGGFGRPRPAKLKLSILPGSAPEVVDAWVNRLIQRPIDERSRRTLVITLEGQPQDQSAVQKLVQLIVTMPEYQLC